MRENVAQLVLDQVNESGAIWQQPGFICDYFYPEDGKVQFGFALPMKLLLNTLAKEKEHFFTVSLEYGKNKDFDPFTGERIHRENIGASERSQFLHPIVREYRYGKMMSEHHTIEDLLAIWQEDIHLKSLKVYIE